MISTSHEIKNVLQKKKKKPAASFASNDFQNWT